MKCAPNFGKETSRETPTCKPKGMSVIMMEKQVYVSMEKSV